MRSWAIVILVVLSACVPARAQETVWMEAENPASANYEVRSSNWGKADLLSGGQWLDYTVNAGQVADSVPEEGVLMAYAFNVPTAGEYVVWGRLGFYWLSEGISWRIDDGPWREFAWADSSPRNLVEMIRWNCLAWARMGTAALEAGDHTLTVRQKPIYQDDRDGQPKPQRMLFAADAYCLSKSGFVPYRKYKPGEDWRTDEDRAAAEQVYRLPAQPGAPARTEISLEGTWQVAAWDETEPVEGRLEMPESTPEASALNWHHIAVPGDRNKVRPDLMMAHRYIYRTRVHVPAAYAGRSFFLYFPTISMVGAVYVNGVRCGYTRAPFAAWHVDATKAVRPGRDNEIWVAIKDNVYAMDSGERELRSFFQVPIGDLRTNQGVTRQFDMPVAHFTRTGILDRPVFVAAGPVYTEDVFANPSVKNKRLALELTIWNPTGSDATVTVRNAVEPWKGGDAEKTFAPLTATVPAGGSVVLYTAEAWENPRLWWPDDPQLYEVVTTIEADGRPVDVKRTRFGFREWDWSGTMFVLNGIPWQLRADEVTHHAPADEDPDERMELMKATGSNMLRMMDHAVYRWCGLNQRQTLEYMDEHGFMVRRCVNFDGMLASYELTERVPGPDGKPVRVARRALFDNYMTDALAAVRGQRNHPSVFIWSIENEITYINSRNFGTLDIVEPELQKVSDAVMKLDPTRPTMVDGGRAHMNQSLPVNGCHYEEVNVRHYPDEAYSFELSSQTSRKQPWPMAMDKPIFLGEAYFSRGLKAAWYASIGGEQCFLGRSEIEHAKGLYARMLAEGYRWRRIAAFELSLDRNIHNQTSYQPVAAFVREWNWTFAAGSKVKRTIGVFNNTRYADPITVNWSLGGEYVKDGKDWAFVDGGKQEVAVAPGGMSTFEIEMELPSIRTRGEGALSITCERNGKEVFRDEKAVSVLPVAPQPVEQAARVAPIAVWEAEGGPVARRIEARGLTVKLIDSLDAVGDARVVVVGPNALDAADATSPRWQSMAAEGRRVVVLDQDHPLRFLAVPADFEVTDYVGRIGFIENAEHPVFRDLRDKDFFCWSGDHVMYRNVYMKAGRGARSLLQCDEELACSAIAECPLGEGVLLLSQAMVGTKLDADPVAQKLFDNMIDYALGYRLVRKRTVAVLPADDPRMELLSGIGLQFTPADDLVATLADPAAEIVVADASAANLGALAGAKEAVVAFTGRGGWLMLWGLAPEGLADFNSLVGYEHLIRPFRREKVALSVPRDPLATGLSQRDVVIQSGERIFGHTSDMYVADDAFSYIVDLADIAPFMQGPGIEYADASRPSSIANGFTAVEAWKYIYYMESMNPEGTPTLTWQLPREETVTSFSIVPNTHYWGIGRFRLVFNGDDAKAQTFDLAPYTTESNPRQDFEVEPVKARSITFQVLDWQNENDRPVTGIDNVWIGVKRPDGFHERVSSLLNIGGLVRYPRGQGGIVLNQLRVPPQETVPVNVQKKRAIVGTILRNLDAAFAARAMLLPGERLDYRPVSLEDHCNLYITGERGWFDKQNDLSLLPLNRQRFAGVTYDIRDFKTSPLENAVAIKGAGPARDLPERVEGIEVGAKADALFFLHTLHRTREWRPRGNQDEPPVVFEYVVTYADGETAVVPVQYGRGVDHWLQAEPVGLRDAALAWTAPARAAEGMSTAIYQMQWNNPRPDVAIESVGLRYPEGNPYGTPVLLALTAATQAVGGGR